MSLTKIFDHLSDAILVMNLEGEMSYYNRKASEIIHGTTIDTLGIGRLSSMLKLVVNEQVGLPFSFKLNLDNQKHTEYQATVSRLYSFFIVSLTHKSRSIHLQDDDAFIHESPQISTSLIKLEALLDIQRIKSTLSTLTNPAGFQLTLDNLQTELDNLHRLVNLTIIEQALNSEPRPLQSLLCEISQNIQHQSWPTTFCLSLYTLPGVNDNLVTYQPTWLESLVTDILNYLLNKSEHVADISLTFEVSHQYLSFTMSLCDQQVLPLQARNLVLKTLVKSTQDTPSPTGTLSPLVIASHITNSVGGNMEVFKNAHFPSVKVKLPTSRDDVEQESEMLFQQGRLYARELAELKLKIDRVNSP